MEWLAGYRCFHILGVYYIIILGVVQYRRLSTFMSRIEVSASLFLCLHSYTVVGSH